MDAVPAKSPEVANLSFGKRSAVSQSSHRSGHGRAANVVGAVASLVGDDSMVNFCGCGWSQASRTLMVSFVLFTVITSAQIAGALISNSMALLADCASMALDAVSYLFNIYAECRPEVEERRKVRNELIASGLSYAVLVGVSVWFLHDGIGGIIDKDWECDSSGSSGNATLGNATDSGSGSGSDCGDDVNPYIVFGFAVGGLTFDILSLLPYCMYGCPCIKKDAGDDGVVDAQSMSLMSALLHVSADLMRSTTTFVESLLIWTAGINGDKADTYATVAVTGTIVVGLMQPIYQWVVGVRDFCSSRGEGYKKDLGVVLVQ